MRLTLVWLDQAGDTVDRTVIVEAEPGQTYDANVFGDRVLVRLDQAATEVDAVSAYPPELAGNAEYGKGIPAEVDPDQADPLARLRSALGPINAHTHVLVDRLAVEWRADELATLATAIERALRTRSRAARMNAAQLVLDQDDPDEGRQLAEWLAEGRDPDTAL